MPERMGAAYGVSDIERSHPVQMVMVARMEVDSVSQRPPVGTTSVIADSALEGDLKSDHGISSDDGRQ